MNGLIRSARRTDVPQIVAMIRELADYEHLTDAVVLDPDHLAEHLFGPTPYAEVLIAERPLAAPVDGQAKTDPGAERSVGFALFFHSYSTFLGKPGIYLEDLYVRPAHRRRGWGRGLFGAVAKLARERGCGRLEWSVLDWNQPAIDFYRRMGAVPLSDWSMFRLAGQALADGPS